MATKFFLRRRAVLSTVNDAFYEASTTQIAAGSTGTSVNTTCTRDVDTKEFYRGLDTGYCATWRGWRGERFSAAFTLSGNMTVVGHAWCTPAGAARLRAVISKRTLGGGDVETIIGQGDSAPLAASGGTSHTITITPTAPVAIVPGERLECRFYLVRETASFDSITSVTFGFDGSLTAGTAKYDASFEITETVAIMPASQTLFLRRTATNGIGTFFDLLDVRGSSAATTAVVNTVASGTEIQWTRTAGGTIAEWITPRFKFPWSLVEAAQVGGTGTSDSALYAHESATAANVTFRAKLFRRTPAGVETEFASWSGMSELTTTAALQWIQEPDTFTAINFSEDDRIVIRLYVIPAPGLTMGGSRTATLTYDHNVANAVGDCKVRMWDIAPFKAEGDSAAKNLVPSGTSMMGMGNGQ